MMFPKQPQQASYWLLRTPASTRTMWRYRPSLSMTRTMICTIWPLMGCNGSTTLSCWTLCHFHTRCVEVSRTRLLSRTPRFLQAQAQWNMKPQRELTLSIVKILASWAHKRSLSKRISHRTRPQKHWKRLLVRLWMLAIHVLIQIRFNRLFRVQLIRTTTQAIYQN